jgi:hypothetical protein
MQMTLCYGLRKKQYIQGMIDGPIEVRRGYGMEKKSGKN